jgi:formylglycine-generating enzyme required for sulfatase activity
MTLPFALPALTHLDILFWLLVMLLAALLFAIEAGLAQQHKRVILCSVASSFVTVIAIMFVIEDKTAINIAAYEQAKKKKKEGDVELEAEGGKKKVEDVKVKETPEKSITEDIDREGEVDRVFSDCDVCPSMVAVKTGTYVMGSPPAEKGRSAGEGPQRPIQIMREFAVSRFEVTREEYDHFVKATGHRSTQGCLAKGKADKKLSHAAPGFEQSGAHPVVCVSYKDAKAYVGWLTRKAGRSYRLLTESEWEFMARGGSTSAYFTGDEITIQQGNLNNARDGTIAVGLTDPNPIGIYDVHGNVAELVEDCWAGEIGLLPEEGSPYEVVEGCQRGVVRGGGWDSPLAGSRSAARRVVAHEAIASNGIGMRVAREMDSQRVEAKTNGPKKKPFGQK